MKNQMIILLCLSSLVFQRCKTRPASASISDQGIHIMAMRIDTAARNIIYNVRVMPEKGLLDADKSIPQKMMYQADSSFYLLRNKVKIYPVSTEYIASGVAGSFEYLVNFESEDVESLQELPLSYQDKFINRKRYQLFFK